MDTMGISISTETLLVLPKSGYMSIRLILVNQLVVQITSRQQKGDSTEKLLDIQQTEDEDIVQSTMVFNATVITVLLGELQSALICEVPYVTTIINEH